MSHKRNRTIYNNLKSRDFGLWSPVLFSLWREEPMTSDGGTIKDLLLVIASETSAGKGSDEIKGFKGKLWLC